MKSSIVALLALICVSCRNTPANNNGSLTSKYDCVLVESEFDESQVVSGKQTKLAFEQFNDSIQNGVLFIIMGFNTSNYDKAIVIDSNKNKQYSFTRDNSKNAPLSSEKSTSVNNLIREVERGAFRQLCYNGPSEGSLSLLLVKSEGKTVMKYESSQHNYSHLNESEKLEIENGLKLISLIESNSAD